MLSYEKSIDVFSGILQKLEPGWVYSSEFPPPEGTHTQSTKQGSEIWEKFTPRDKTAEEKTAMAHPKTTVGNHVANSDLDRDSKILDFGAGRGTQSRRLQGIGEYAPGEPHEEHAPDEPFKNVHSYDTQPPYDDESKLDDKYDTVMASNVLNVQSNDEQLTSTLDQLKGLLNDGGHIIANFPSTPNKHDDIKSPDAMEARLKDHFGEHNVEKVKPRHWKVTNKSKDLQKIVTGAIQGGARNPTAGELNKPRELDKPRKKSDNMNSYKDLQNFYKENYDLEKAQKVRNPWAVARAIVDGTSGEGTGNKGHWQALWADQIDPNADEDEKRSMMGRIVAGIEQNKWNKMLKAVDIKKKMSPAMGALAGWWLGGEIQDIIQGHSQATPAQQREFERQIQAQMRRGIKKETTSMDDLQTFYSDADDTYIRRGAVANGVDVQKAGTYIKTPGGGQHLSAPPRPGETLNPFTHRWTKRENQTEVKTSQGGKARLGRASGTGTMERSVGGHGKGKVRETEAGRRGITHGDRLKPGFEHPDEKQGRSKKDANEKDRKKVHSRNSTKQGTSS